MMRSYLLRYKLWPVLLMLFGASAIIVAVGVALTGIGGSKGFGIKKVMLGLVGFAILLKGVDLLTSSSMSAPQSKSIDRSLKRWITIFGAVNIFCFSFYFVMSYGLAPVSPFGDVEPYRAIIFDPLAESINFLGGSAQAFVSGQSLLIKENFWLLVYCLPVVVTTVVSVSLLTWLARLRYSQDETTPQNLFRWAIAFAVLVALAYPVLVQDFWYGLAWGRMVEAGGNPYHAGLLPEFTQGLPLGDRHPPQMMYGPLWAIISGVVMWFAGGRVLLGAILFKLLLAGAWIGSLWLVWSMLRRQSLWHQCVGIIIFGWLPLGLIQTVGDGHNDVFMVFFLLLWLYGLQRSKSIGASLSLAISTLIKYVAAPMFILDFLHSIISRKQKLLKYLPNIIAVGAISFVTFEKFYRSLDFFWFLSYMKNWHFYTPREGVKTLEIMMGLKVPFSTEIVRIFFLALPLYFIVRYIRKPDTTAFGKVVLAILCALLFGGVTSHIWPWYLVWVLAVAATVPGAALTRWVLGVALVTPFPIVVWNVFGWQGNGWVVFDVPALLLYTFAVLWYLIVPRRWFPDAESNETDSPNVREVRMPLVRD